MPGRRAGDVGYLKLLPSVKSVLLDMLEGICIPAFFFKSYCLGLIMLGSMTSWISWLKTPPESLDDTGSLFFIGRPPIFGT